jgi:hypothetical protein
MQHRKAATTANFNASTWTIIAAILLLVVILGGLTYRNFGPSGPVPVKTATSDWLEKLERERR